MDQHRPILEYGSPRKATTASDLIGIALAIVGGFVLVTGLIICVAMCIARWRGIK